MRRLIVTGDDYGLAVPVNEAIIEAHRRGILTTASLMVGGGAAADAIERARRVPSLRVGLHVVLVEGRPVLPPEAIPDLVDARGEFSNHPARAGFKFALWPGIRQQLQAEIRAQFEAFRKTGLALDHADSHNHLHLHPRIMSLILEVGRDYGLPAMRLPNEPFLPSWRAAKKSPIARLAAWTSLSPLIALMKSRLRHSRVRCNDFIFGMADTGAMTTELVLRFLQHLPEGVTEIYFHPSTRRCPEIDRTMPAYLHEEEFKALTSSEVLEACAAEGIQRTTFNGL
ncbi:MAG: hopanoid biosynthesis-associated protein HpnK [Acidobacteriia bacterium]|nr:hopanoid biosynthesis-associated protein HpnK [Terriglobia bacterium]